MADEPRRSGRATKGQTTKTKEVSDETSVKKKGKGKAGKSKPVEEEEEEEEEEEGGEIIRCVCGQYEEEEDVPRQMICCDNCSAWQHNDCMGLPDTYEPDQYFCEQCKPGNHKELLAAMQKGERPWEEAARKREAADAEKNKKKGGKRGRKSAAARTSDVIAPEPEEPAVTPSAGTKRKADESPAVTESKTSKKARNTPAAEPDVPPTERTKSPTPTPVKEEEPKAEPATPVVKDMKDLDNATRKGAAGSLIKLLIDQTKDAAKRGSYTIPSGTTAQELGTRLGLELENALFQVQAGGAGEPNEAYKAQLRAIVFNVKKNPQLAIRMLQKELDPEGLADMDAKDMASEEQQRKDAAIMKVMEKQHTIIGEQGPRIRRTHKGEEYIDESQQIAAESKTSNAPVRKPSVVQDATPQSPETSTAKEANTSRPLQRMSTGGQSRPRPSIDVKRQSSSNFDIDKVWSNVQGSPDTDAPRFGELPQSAPVREPVGPGTRADADIDELLKDEDAESPPYSPKDFSDPDGTVWRGIVNGGNLGRFHATAKFAAGATPDSPTLRMTYQQLVPAEIGIGGRIQPAKADEYLCGLEYSSTTDLVVVYMREPEGSHDLEQFEKLFKYFRNKDRFGVGVQHENPAVKDIYLIPLNAGQEMPTFIKKLETVFPDPAKERMFLVPIVIKNSELLHNLSNPGQVDGATAVASPGPGTAVAQTPITPHEGGFDHHTTFYGNSVPYNQPPPAMPHGPNGTSQGFHQSPPPAAYPFPIAPPQQQPDSKAPSASPGPSTTAVAAAQKVLGHLASAPAVLRLIQQVPMAGETEMRVVGECIEENPEAAQSLEVLTAMLQRRQSA